MPFSDEMLLISEAVDIWGDFKVNINKQMSVQCEWRGRTSSPRAEVVKMWSSLSNHIRWIVPLTTSYPTSPSREWDRQRWPCLRVRTLFSRYSIVVLIEIQCRCCFKVIARENKGPGIGIEYAYSRPATSVYNPSPSQLSSLRDGFQWKNVWCLIWITSFHFVRNQICL